MFRRKKIHRKKKYKLAKLRAKAVQPASEEEKLSDKWYTQDQLLDYLDMSISTCQRRRDDGSLIASKKFGKIYFNDYHVQKMLRDGLQNPLIWLGYLAALADGLDVLLAA